MSNLSESGNLIETLANEMAVSRSSLHKKIKSISGMTPNDYIQLIRLKRAAELLSGNEYQISEIAYLVGFNSPSYFSKCFYNQFGMLPRDFVMKTKVDLWKFYLVYKLYNFSQTSFFDSQSPYFLPIHFIATSYAPCSHLIYIWGGSGECIDNLPILTWWIVKF